MNEAYLNFAKDKFFVRVGRQAISWGEADTIGPVSYTHLDVYKRQPRHSEFAEARA